MVRSDTDPITVISFAKTAAQSSRILTWLRTERFISDVGLGGNKRAVSSLTSMQELQDNNVLSTTVRCTGVGS